MSVTNAYDLNGKFINLHDSVHIETLGCWSVENFKEPRVDEALKASEKLQGKFPGNKRLAYLSVSL